ncbi:MAG: hypothetical protein MZV70_67745 [Desulfobacterales bacterium]|nr:hypothetical protein [Desulfobacterales bacterium]
MLDHPATTTRLGLFNGDIGMTPARSRPTADGSAVYFPDAGRRAAPLPAAPPARARDGLRHDGAQEPGLRVRRGAAGPAGRGLARSSPAN